MDHDQLFKQLLKLFFPDLLELTVPKMAKRLDLEKVKFLEQESFSDVPIGERVLHDLLAEAPTLDDAREIESILFLVEVEGRFRRAAEEKLWRYYAHARLKYRRPVLLIVLWLRGGPPGVSRLQLVDHVLGEEVHRMTYIGFGLSRSSAEDFLARPEPIAWALAALMRSANPDRAEHKLACLRLIAHAEVDDVRQLILLNIVETYLELNDEEAERYAARLASETEDVEVRAMALTWSEKMEAKGYELGLERGVQQGLERGVQQGLERGVQQGLERGVQQGLRQMTQMVQHLLERRFGPLPQAALERLAAIRDPSTLDQLGQRLLDARSLEELGLVANLQKGSG